MENKLSKNTFEIFNNIIERHKILIPLVVLFIIVSLATPSFLDRSNMINILRQISVLSIVSIGSTIIILTGGIDLSVGSIMALVAVFVAKGVKTGTPLPFLVLTGIIMGILIGMINGLFIINFTVPAFIVTLATMTIGRGFVLLWTGGSNVNELNNEAFLFFGRGSVLGIPFPIIVMLLMYILGCLILSKTKFGREIYAIGNNEEASKISGIFVKRTLLSVYIIAGLAAAVGAVIDTSRMNTVTPMYGSGIEFDCISAVILGGASFDGGIGMLINTLFGAILLGLINNAFNLMGVSSYWAQIAKGIILISAIMIYSYKTNNE